MKTAKIETYVNGQPIPRDHISYWKKSDTFTYKVEHTDNQARGGIMFDTKLEAWRYLTIYEEDNPERACQIYSYAKKYLNDYPHLNNEVL